MPPNQKAVFCKPEVPVPETKKVSSGKRVSTKEDEEYVFRILWEQVAIQVAIHAMGLYGGYLFFTGAAMWQTYVFGESKLHLMKKNPAKMH